MAYVQYTIKNNQGVIVVYRCSKCGEINVTVQRLTSQAMYTSKGTWTKKGLEKRENAAKNVLKERAAEVLSKAKGTIRIKDYKELNLRGVCSKCHHKEPWSRIISPIVEVLCYFGALIGIATVFFALNGAINFTTVLTLLACAVPFAWKYGKIVICEKKISLLDEENLPKVFTNAKSAEVYAEKLGKVWGEEEKDILINEGNEGDNNAFENEKPAKQTTKQNESHYVRSAPSNSTVYTDTKISKKILGKKAKNVFNGKTEAIGKVLHYSYSGKAKIVCDENEICIFDEKTNEMKTSLQFCNVAYIEISKGMGGKTSVAFATSSGETLEIIVSKDASIINGILKMKEILDNSADN